MLSMVGPRMGSSIQGRLEAGLLFTPAYVARVKAQVTALRTAEPRI